LHIIGSPFCNKKFCGGEKVQNLSRQHFRVSDEQVWLNSVVGAFLDDFGDRNFPFSKFPSRKQLPPKNHLKITQFTKMLKNQLWVSTNKSFAKNAQVFAFGYSR